MYLKHTHKYRNGRIGEGRQRGGLTVFTAVLVLIMMTLLLVYATRVSLFETRVSGNEMRQKEAFQVAEAALDQSIMYLFKNVALVLSSAVDKFPDGTGFDRDGWFATGNVHWQPCPSPAAATHPCGGGISAPASSYYYDTDGDTSTLEGLPVNTADFPAGTTARMSALLCYIGDPTTPSACADPTALTVEEQANASLVLILLSYGYSDCTDTTDVSTCTGEATVAVPVSNFKNFGGSPAVPLVSKSTFPPTGTAEVVANPNAGGLGVPMSVWANENPSCSPANPITSSGTWQTCEMQEWYHTEEYPEDVTCTDNNCMCGPGGNDEKWFISWKKSLTTVVGIDIVSDPAFPCDLFEHYFNVPRSQYLTIKNQAKILSDCSSLGPQSSGLIWISGSECKINSNTIVGSSDNPVILVSAATHTIIAGGVNIYGVLYIFDGEDSLADLTTLGGAVVYGATIVDAAINAFQGTFQVVYAESVLAEANGIAGLGTVNGGWRDFGLPDIGW